MKCSLRFIGIILLSPLFGSCASLPALSALLPTGVATATGQGIHVTINVMSNNTTNTCTCRNCGK